MRNAVALLLLLGLLTGPLAAQSAEEGTPGISALQFLPDESGELSESEQAQEEAILQKLLDTDIDLQLVDTPLKDVAKLLSERTGISIRIDNRALNEVGLTADIPVSINLRGVRAQTVMRLMLRELDLTYVTEAEGIVLTTPSEAESHLKTRYYPVKELIYVEPFRPGMQPDFDSLIELITTTVQPESWSESGFDMAPYGDGLVLAQTEDVHEYVASLLSAARQAKSMPADAYNTTPILAHPLKDRMIEFRKHLNEKTVSFDFSETPLSEAASQLAEKGGIQIHFDLRALEEVGLSDDLTLTLETQEVPLARALDRLTDHCELAWYSIDNVVILTTPQELETELETRVYPIRDLLWHGLDISEPRLGGILEQNSLLGVGGGFGGPAPPKIEVLNVPPFNDFDGLIEALVSGVPEDWEETGGPGSICPYSYGGCLVISHTEHVHEKLAALLREIRRHRTPLDPEAVSKEIEDARARPRTIAYDAPPGRQPLSREDKGKLVYRLTSMVAKESWDDTTNFIDITEQGLVVRHRADVQREVFEFLRPLGFTIKADQNIVIQPGAGMNGGFSASKSEFGGGGSQPGGVF